MVQIIQERNFDTPNMGKKGDSLCMILIERFPKQNPTKSVKSPELNIQNIRPFHPNVTFIQKPAPDKLFRKLGFKSNF